MAAWPLTARGQQGSPVIGLLSGFSPAGGAESLAAFRQGLSEAGFTEHQNIGIEFAGRKAATSGYRRWQPI